MMLYSQEAVPFYWHDPLVASNQTSPNEITKIPFSAHTAPTHYYEEQENN